MNTRTSSLLFQRRTVAIIVAALLLAALAACGGKSSTTLSPVAGAPTAAQQTQTTPTTAPTEVQAAVATETPAATPSPTPTPAATDTPAPTEAVTKGDCDNAFYPVVDGRIYHYNSTTSAAGEVPFTVAFSDVAASSFMETLTTPSWSTETTWTCTADGILSPQYGILTGMLQGTGIEFPEASGITLPNDDKFAPGATWTTHYKATISKAVPETGTTVNAVETIELNNKVVGTDPVSVPYGDFPNALRVETTGTISISASVGGVASPSSNIPITVDTWYVEGVGMVKQSSAKLPFIGGEGDISEELVSFDN